MRNAVETAQVARRGPPDPASNDGLGFCHDAPIGEEGGWVATHIIARNCVVKGRTMIGADAHAAGAEVRDL